MKRLLTVLVATLALPGSASGGAPSTVFAAASLTHALPRIDPAPRYSFAGSDQLAIQIQQGEPADVFAAARPNQPDLLFRNGLVPRRGALATNQPRVLASRSNP